MKPFPAGKLPPRIFQGLLAACQVPRNSRVVLGPRFGEDAAVIDMGDKYLVAKTDPITFTSERIGWYAVNINANDVAAAGARPLWFLATLLLPETSTSLPLVRNIFQDTLRACADLGVTLCGGHTEITRGLDRPILVGQMLGEVVKSKLVRKESQRPGDVVLLTGGIAIEGTAILAREKRQALGRELPRKILRQARRLLFRPGISVVRDALLAQRHGEIHAMHDPTEGGLTSGLYELAKAGGVGLRVYKEKVPILEETRRFSEILGFDSFALIASGSLLVVATAESAPTLLRAYWRRNVTAAIIGEVREAADGVLWVENGRTKPLRVPERDEIARLL
ncbi:MAG: AIR synthase family protein [Terriglobia bacterium]|jgi:hydrogenase expression/formation protein HypE